MEDWEGTWRPIPPKRGFPLGIMEREEDGLRLAYGSPSTHAPSALNLFARNAVRQVKIGAYYSPHKLYLIVLEDINTGERRLCDVGAGDVRLDHAWAGGVKPTREVRKLLAMLLVEYQKEPSLRQRQASRARSERRGTAP